MGAMGLMEIWVRIRQGTLKKWPRLLTCEGKLIIPQPGPDFWQKMAPRCRWRRDRRPRIVAPHRRRRPRATTEMAMSIFDRRAGCYTTGMMRMEVREYRWEWPSYAVAQEMLRREVEAINSSQLPFNREASVRIGRSIEELWSPQKED